MARSLLTRFVSTVGRSVPDGPYSIAQFVRHQKRLPRLRAPRTVNEKLLWLKMHDDNPLLEICSDKLRVRDHVRSVVSDEILVPLLGVYEHPGQIPYDELPEQFVLKPTHGSGWIVFCRSKRTFDREQAAAKLSSWLATDFYQLSRERPYEKIPRRIVCEQFLTVDGQKSPPDYKLWCFNGEPAYVQVDRNRATDHQHAFYDVKWNKLPCWIKPRFDETVLPPPDAFPKLLEVARALAAPFAFVRVDLYALVDRVYFGELTFIPRNLRSRFRPKEYDRIFGDHLVLPGRPGSDRRLGAAP